MKRVILCIVAMATMSLLLTACGGTGGLDIAAVQTQAARDFAATLTAEAPTSTPAEAPSTEIPTPEPTPTEIPTLEPTPTEVQPTSTPTPSPTPVSQARITEGSLRVNEWQVELVDVRTSPGRASNRKNVFLIVDVTNVGQQTSTFIGMYILLRDGQGRTYEDDTGGSHDCIDTYGLALAASINPGAMEHTCISYDVPLESFSFVAVPHQYVVSTWQGGLTFELP